MLPVVASTVARGADCARALRGWLDTLLLRSTNPRLRCKAVEGLSGSDRPSDTQLLLASLEDKDPRVRCAAVRALANGKRPDCLDRLAGALQDASFEVREAAARALGRLDGLRCAEAVAACLSDPDVAVRIAAAGALRSMGWRPSTGEELARFEIALGQTPAAGPVSSVPAGGAVDPNQDTSFHRRLAAAAQQEKSNPARIRSLLADLRSNNLLSRISAVHDLGQISDPRITAELLRLFRHPDGETRLAAAQVVAARVDSRPAHFVGLLQDTSPEVRLAAVHYLGKVRHEQIAQVLVPLLSDPNLLVRQATAAAVKEIGEACDARGQIGRSG